MNLASLCEGFSARNYDVLHLQVPNAMVVERREAALGQPARYWGPLFPRKPTVDPILTRLAQAYLEAEDLGGAFGRNYADAIGFAIIARLFGRHADIGAPISTSRVTPLTKWRLKRATDYMRAHLSNTISLFGGSKTGQPKHLFARSDVRLRRAAT
jgi:AraC family transcriptional regulator